MAGYVRQSTADIIPTATVRAAPINAEYNAIRDAFAASGGHKHDGTTGEGEYIPLIADLDALNKIVVDTTNNRFGVFIEVGATAVEQVRFQDGVIVPVTDNDIDLGTSALEFKNLYLDGTAKIDTLTVDENATVAGTLGVTSNTTLGGTLAVTGATTLSSTLGVTGNTTLGGTLGVTGATTLSSTLAVTGSATLSSTLSVSSNATVGGTLAVTGTTSSTGDFSVNTNKFTVAAGTGNTAVAGTLGVTGNTTVGGTLGVTGAATLSSTASISGNTTIGGTLGVTGTTTYSTLTGSNLTATGTVNFSGATVSNLGTVTTAAIGGGTINNTIIGGSTPAAITGTTITGTSLVGPVTGNVTGNITGNVTGNVTASSGASTFNNVTINGTLDVTNTTIENVSDPTTAQQAATKAYVDSEITNLIGGAPAALDTLNELAAAINDDENVYTTLTTSIATKLPKAGGTMTGAIAMGNNKITGLATPTADADAATKLYVDDQTTQAETYAANALASANAAAASYDSFDDRYLGSKASDPTLDNDGNALLTGALYFDSTNGVMKVYNGTEWANASSSIEGIKSNFYYTATSGQTLFSGADDNTNTLVVDQVDLVNVYMNGVRLHEDDYTVSAAGNSVTLATGAATGDLIYLEVFGNFAGQSGAEVAITGGSITGLSDFGAAQGAFTGNVTFGDNNKAMFGAGNDLQLYHDGSNSYLRDNGGGNLRITTDSRVYISKHNDENMIRATANGAVDLYYDGESKLETTSTGIDVTGTVTADGLTVGAANGLVLGTSGATEASWTHNSVNGESTISVGRNAGWGGDLNINTDTLRRMRIQNNGDISFYEDTGTTPKFFWDASAESLGIGTSSPDVTLELSSAVGTSTSLAKLRNSSAAATSNISRIDFEFDNSFSGTNVDVQIGAVKTNAGNEESAFFVSTTSGTGTPTERLRVDASGRVGIGTSPATGVNLHLHEAGSGQMLMAFTNDTTGSGSNDGLHVGIDSSENSFIYNKENTALYFGTNNTERMRIDSSGNLLVGTTTNSSSNNGVTAGNGGLITATRTSNYSAIFNRKTSDGDIVQFRKDGSTVGSIGSDGGAIYIGNTAGEQFKFHNGSGGSFYPKTDNNNDLGASSNRFKDLYLSGGVYLGGTGSANKLDDYEEGTFTPTVAGSSTAGTATYTRQVGRYIKVGHLLHVTGWVEFNSLNGTGDLLIKGMPFTAKNIGYLVTPGSVVLSSITIPSNRTYVTTRSQDSFTYLRLLASGSNNAPQAIPVEAAGTINFSCTYMTT